MTSPSDNTLVARLRGLVTQLTRMIDGASFVRDGYVRVLDPGYLVSQLSEAATALEASYAENERLTEALRPFARCSEVYPNADDSYEAGFGAVHDPRCPLTLGDFRRARTALKDSPK